MKTLVAAALILNAHSHDETSLMQGLALRVDGKLGADGNTKKDSTAKLMETATKMLKNGAGVTPDVVHFIEETIQELELNVLGAITDGHTEDQAELTRIVGEMEEAISLYNTHLAAHATATQTYGEAGIAHKECRNIESDNCGESRECEVELAIRWRKVKQEERYMREIHGWIHGGWCEPIPLPAPLPHGPQCFDNGADCWHWTEETEMEGPETSVTVGSYPVADYHSDVRDFRSTSVTWFGQYIAQKLVVEEAWERYNEWILVCSTKEDTLEARRTQCDTFQDELSSQSCELTQDDREARRAFGLEFARVTEAYDEAAGTCTNSAGECCDIHALHEAEIAGGGTFEGAAVDLTCSCTGTRQKEFDRKREWETLHIVTCLLNTVYTHVQRSIESGEPCPTTETHPEQTEQEITFCHVLELSLTTNLTIDYCGDDLPLECPTPPNPPPPVPPPCTAEYVFDTTGHFGSFIDTFVPHNDVHVNLGPTNWGSCAAPKACISCLGHASDLPDPVYVEMSSPCLEHQSHLALGESNSDTFRCHTTLPSHIQAPGSCLAYPPHLSSCVPMSARCNGVDNCHDGSDEIGCDTAWAVPTWLAVGGSCRSGATMQPGEQDDVQFRCNDDSCIAVQGRCNGEKNCADDSDELNCPENLDGVSVEALSGLVGAELTTISNGASVFYDRGYTFKSLGSFTGTKFVKYSNEDKFTPQSHVQMKLRLPQPMTLYVVQEHGQHLSWLHSEGWTEVPALTAPTYSGDRRTPDKEWHEGHWKLLDTGLYGWHGVPLSGEVDPNHGTDHIDREELHYGSGASVWEKTFPAGVVSMRGNGGGQGYLWSSEIEGGHGSYMLFVAHPAHPPTPHLPFQPNSELTAYWDSGSCGAHGNDHNAAWCGGVINGNHPADNCEQFVTVPQSTCASQVATLHSYEGDGTCCSSVTIDDCNYAYFAQYRCAEDHEVPVVVLPVQFDTRLAAYWDSGVCGPHGEDFNWDWCNQNAGHPAEQCATSVEVPTDICATGHASLESTQGTGECCSSVTIDSCNYAYYAQYVCSDAPGPIVVDPQPVFNTELTAYWDSGSCGPHGNDFNWDWCDMTAGNCPDQVTVASSLCASNTAVLSIFSGDGSCCSSVTLDGCNYAYHAQYVCAPSECQHLANQDVVAGTFGHFGFDITGTSSDAACSQHCTDTAGCTAWVRQPSTGNCWISNQAVVTFEADTDRTAGLRCN